MNRLPFMLSASVLTVTAILVLPTRPVAQEKADRPKVKLSQKARASGGISAEHIRLRRGHARVEGIAVAVQGKAVRVTAGSDIQDLPPSLMFFKLTLRRQPKNEVVYEGSYAEDGVIVGPGQVCNAPFGDVIEPPPGHYAVAVSLHQALIGAPFLTSPPRTLSSQYTDFVIP